MNLIVLEKLKRNILFYDSYELNSFTRKVILINEVAVVKKVKVTVGCPMDYAELKGFVNFFLIAHTLNLLFRILRTKMDQIN